MRPVFFVLFALLAWSCEPLPVDTATDEPLDAETVAQAKLVRDISTLVRGRPLSNATANQLASQLQRGDTTIEVIIDSQLKSKDVGERVAKSILLGGGQSTKTRHPFAEHSILKMASPIDGTPLLYLREPCAPEDAELVQPWWDSESQVYVCPDSHRPDVLTDAEGRTCGSTMLSPSASNVCGCGPRLMFCTGDANHIAVMRREAQREVSSTIAWVINKDRPLDDLFTMNPTIRNRNSEFLYRRARVAAGEDPAILDMTDFDNKTKLRPRHEQVPGHHAGILTAPSIVYGSDALRGVMRNYYDYLWCSGQASSKVTTDGILALDVVDLRTGDGWRDLASMPICTECHARLDYGMQFFKGYPSSTEGIDFRPDESLKGEGALYGEHIDDMRGETELNPRGFAEIVLAQEEFSACMTKKIVDHVFSGQASTEEFDLALRTFEETRRFKPTMRAALVQFARRADGPPPSESHTPSTPAAAAPEGDTVTLSPALREGLDNFCIECHDEEDPYPFTASTYDRETLHDMLEKVAFGTMPKNAEGLDLADRTQLVNHYVDLLWANPEAREEARAFFTGTLLAHPVHRYRAAMATITTQQNVKNNVKSPASVEPAVAQPLNRYSPGYATATALRALAACKTHVSTDAELEDCVTRATSPSTFILGPSE